MFYCKTPKNEHLMKEGDGASTFFILAQGKIKVSVNNQTIRELQLGDGFGELALLYNVPRSASCFTLEDSYFWAIERSTFRSLVQEMSLEQYAENRSFVEKHQFFANFTEHQKDTIASVLIEQKFHQNETIVHEEDEASSFYIIKSGQVVALKNGKSVRFLSKGDAFGEQALLQGKQTRSMTIKAISQEAICIALAKEVVRQILGDEVENIIYRNMAKWGLAKLKKYTMLTKSQKETFLSCLEVKSYKNGETVFKEGTNISEFIIIGLEGELTQGDNIFISQMQILGDLEDPDKEQLLQNNVISKSKKAKIGIINIKEVSNKMGNSFSNIVSMLMSQNEKNKNESLQLQKNLQEMVLEDFECIKKLGSGQYGSVFLIKHKQTNELYGMKCIQKAKVFKKSLQPNVTNEYNIMKQNCHPFIMRFYRSFKDKKQIYFLLEYIRGKELFDVVQSIGILNSQSTQFYIGSCILAVEHLHRRHIIHRDIKPENAMVNDRGYIKLIDMGIAKLVKGNQKTFTITGTPNYTAPEIVIGKGYSHFVDLWSIGVMMYEFMVGSMPFGENSEDPFSIYEEICFNEISFPEQFQDQDAKSLILQLLSKTPEVRLGGSFQKLKAAQFFSGLDWQLLYEGLLKPPCIPEVAELQENAQCISIAEQIKIEGIPAPEDIKVKGKVYDDSWSDIF